MIFPGNSHSNDVTDHPRTGIIISRNTVKSREMPRSLALTDITVHREKPFTQNDKTKRETYK